MLPAVILPFSLNLLHAGGRKRRYLISTGRVQPPLPADEGKNEQQISGAGTEFVAGRETGSLRFQGAMNLFTPGI